MTPYYQDELVTIYHGDWRNLALSADAVVTDPPYGIRADEKQSNRANKQHGKALAPSRDYGETEWDRYAPTMAEFRQLLEIGRWHIFWGGNHFGLPGATGWLVWDKETGSNGYADCELAWTDLPQAVRRFRFQWMGMLQRLPEERWHPTQKPLPVMRWALGFLPKETGTVLDPYMGSGTTLRAAKDLGIKAIGVEVQERYCEIAAKRCGQEVLFGGVAA